MWAKLLHNADTLLLSLIININVLRFFLNIEDTSLSLYILYIACIISLYIKNKQNLKIRIKNSVTIKSYCFFWGLCLSYFVVTCCIFTYEFQILCKYLVAIIIAILCLGFEIKKIKSLFFIIFFINFIFTLKILSNIDFVYSYMAGSVNYLNMTLTLGLCLSLALSSVVLSILNKIRNRLLLFSSLTLFFFLAILPFPARGVMLFPPLIAIIIALINGKKHKLKLLSIFIGLAVIVLVGAYYFLQNASEYALIHMTNLFEDTEDESRIGLWATAFNAVFNNYWVFWGAGLNGFKLIMDFYPHNIFVHLLADTGFVGFIGFSIFVYYIIIKYINVGRRAPTDCAEAYHWCFISFLYYLLTFCKSFSMYDSCPLLIMISLCLCYVSLNTPDIR